VQIPTIADEAGGRPDRELNRKDVEAHLSFRDATSIDASRQVPESYSLATARMRTRLIHLMHHPHPLGP
jgi:hypothetical protein